MGLSSPGFSSLRIPGKEKIKQFRKLLVSNLIHITAMSITIFKPGDMKAASGYSSEANEVRKFGVGEF